MTPARSRWNGLPRDLRITATDPFTYGAVAVLVAATGFLGHSRPSRWAMRLEPLSVVRE